MSGYFNPPIPAETNPPINPQYFQPSRFYISNIVLGRRTVVTTETAHNYVLGQQVKLLIPSTYGCIQLNETTGYVAFIPSSTQVTVTIDSSTNVNAFISSPTYGTTQPQIIAIGDINTGYINPTGNTTQTTTIPGSFITTSY